MRWIEQQVAFHGDDGRRHSQSRRAAADEPGRADILQRSRSRYGKPVLGQSERIDNLSREVIGQIDGEQSEVVRSREGVYMDENLKCCQCCRAGGVEDGMALGMPATGGIQGTEASQGGVNIGLPADPPDAHQLKSP
jgi:hypothetical protein